MQWGVAGAVSDLMWEIFLSSVTSLQTGACACFWLLVTPRRGCRYLSGKAPRLLYHGRNETIFTATEVIVVCYSRGCYPKPQAAACIGESHNTWRVLLQM